MNPISPYFKLPCATSRYSQSVLSQPSNNFLAEDKLLLVPHLNQQDTQYQLLCKGLLSFLPIPLNSFTDFILTALRKMRQEDPQRTQDQPG